MATNYSSGGAGENTTNDLEIEISSENSQEEDGSNNQQRPDFANTYLAKSHPVIRGFFAALEIRLRMAHEAFISSPGDNKDILTTLKLFLQEEAPELSRVCEEQGAMLRDHQSMANNFDEDLRRMLFQKILSGVFFSTAAAICAAMGAIAAINAQNNPRWTAGAGVAAAATISLVALGSGVHRVLDKRERGVKQGKEAIAAMIAAEQLAIVYFRSVYNLVTDLYAETVFALGTVVGDDVALRMNLTALNRSFQELLIKANQYGLDVNSVTEAALQTIIRNG